MQTVAIVWGVAGIGLAMAFHLAGPARDGRAAA
jgi:hypothetical protein